MKALFTFLFFASCLALSSATLKLLKSKLKPAQLIYPARYQTVKYLASPVVVPEPLPAAYARPAVNYGSYLATYKVSPPSVVTYSAPIQTYSASVVYAKPLITHEVSPAWYYTEPETVYAEPLSTHVVEEHFSTYDDRKR